MHACVKSSFEQLQTKGFNFTLGCIVPFSGVTPTKKVSEKIKKNREERRGMEKYREKNKDKQQQQMKLVH